MHFSYTRAAEHRARRAKLAQAQGRTIRPRKATGIDTTDKTAYRREYKRMLRRNAGATPRVDIQAATQAKRETVAETKTIKQAIAGLHEAHVKRYREVLLARSYYAKRYKANPQAERDRIAKTKQALCDAYVIQNIKAMGIPADVISPELIALKRASMRYRRLARTIKTTVKNHLKEDHETITKHA